MASSSKRFRIAFSFAGEKRPFVKEVADLLAARFGEDQILYDHYHEAEFAQPDLAFDLPDLYKSEADLIVSVFCNDYENKEWCGLEWRSIISMIKEEQAKKILLTRFDYAEAKGLHGLSGFIELDNRTPEVAYQLILQRLALNEGHPKNHYLSEEEAPLEEVTARALITNNLPRLPHFFGREQELITIAQALHPDARTWGALIDGPGGMGKTSLAIRAAELVSPAHFDRILFLSAKDRELTPDGEKSLRQFSVPAYLEILNGIATELDRNEINKSKPDDRAALVLDALRGTKTLLLIDNLESLPNEDADLLFSFLSRLPQDGKALITSRRRTDIDARILRLEKLGHEAALAYLEELAQDRPLLKKATAEERESLYAETGGNPLLIRWLIGQLGNGRCQTVSAALDFLRSAPADNDPLEFIFGDLAQTFTPEETATVCALSYFTKPIESEHLAHLANLTEIATETSLINLIGRSLVIADDRRSTYILTPLVGDYLPKAHPKIFTETGTRIEDQAYALIMQNGFQNYDRFPALDKAWPTVAPALPLFLAGENTRLQKICDALTHFLEFTGRWDEWLSLFQQAEQRALTASNYHDAGRRAYQCGYLHRLRNEADLVLAYANRAKDYWEKAQAGPREQAYALRLQGMGLKLKKDDSAALKTYTKVLELFKNLNSESADVALTLNSIANLHNSSGDFPACAENYREALRIAKAIDHQEGIVAYSVNLADLALDEEKWPEAEALAREALTLAEDLGRRELIASNHECLAKSLTKQSKASEALPHALSAVEIFTSLASPRLKSAKAILAECQAASEEK